MTRPHLFFDFDDTLSEQIPINLQYVRGIGSALASRFGGEEEAWAKRAIDMLETLEAQYIARFQHDPAGYNAWFDGLHAQAMTLVFGGMGLPVPPDAAPLSVEIQRLALSRCNAAFAGTRDVIASLHRQGWALHMASGNDSGHLRGALIGAGMDTYFDRLYGPDLIDCAKEGPAFYARLFQHIGLAPAACLIVDNDPNVLAWAVSLGANAVQADFLSYKQTATAPGIAGKITDMAQLPALLTQMFT